MRICMGMIMGLKKALGKDMSEVLEKLAKAEHDQWAHWTEYMLNNLTPQNISRWKKQVETQYANLTEIEKESDRKWARIVLDIINE